MQVYSLCTFSLESRVRKKKASTQTNRKTPPDN